MVNNGIEQTDPPGQGKRSRGPWSQINTMPNSTDPTPLVGPPGLDNPEGPAPAAAPLRQTLSALMDGELAPGELAGACAAWQQHSDVRSHWHAYHLIGDVLRSDDLAVPAARDEQFLQALRGRLALEPAPAAPTPWVVVAPETPRPLAPADEARQPASLTAPARRHAGAWLMAPAALAAGFMLVAGVVVVSKLVQPGPAAAPQLAQSAPAAGALVRDARLDRYLAAHRSLGNGLAPAGGVERTVQIVYEQK